jgi:DNA-binding response OmpR family regulator
MSDINILIVEDDSRIREIVRTYTVKEHYNLYEAGTGREAFELLDQRGYQAIILDVMLPDTDGWTILRKVRQESDIPIIMLTARGEEEDKLFGFDLGADDYLTKPFSAKELMARIKLILKRRHSAVANDLILIKGIEINTSFHQVSLDGKIIEMTPLEYKLLLFFVDNQNLALTRTQILDAVWGYDYFGDERTVDTHVKRLRAKIEVYGELIKTVRGLGYRLVVDQ